MKNFVETLLVENQILVANDLIGRCALEVGNIYDLDLTAKRILGLLVPKLADLASLDFRGRRIAVACGTEEYADLLPEFRANIWDQFEISEADPLSPTILPNDSPLFKEIEGRLGREVHAAIVVPIQSHACLTLIHLRRTYASPDIHLLERVGHFLGSILSERAASEAERLDAVRRNMLLSMASHDLKTPLTALQLQIQLLRTLENNSESSSKVYNLINSSVKTLGDCIGSLTNFGDIQANKTELRRTHFNLSHLVQEIQERLELVLASAKIEVRFSCTSAVSGTWDQPKIDRLISNLLANAVKYASGAPVEITLSQNEEAALLIVRDHGPGIPPAEIDKIFDCYYRAGETSDREGLGLGLYISRCIAVSHGGTLRVENADGGGARFSLELPFLTKEDARD